MNGMGNQGANISVTNQTECREGAGFFFSTQYCLKKQRLAGVSAQETKPPADTIKARGVLGRQ